MEPTPLHAASLFDLTGKTAVITGASSGLGVTFANALAANGANIVLAARREDRLKAVQASLPSGTRSIVTPCDITQPDQIEAMCETAIGEFGAIDIFIANAGVVAEGVPAIEKTPPGLFAAGIDANVTGTFNCLTAAARRMLPAGKGSIIIVASIAGMSGHRGFFPAYCAAKAALIEMAKNMGSAWASRGVRVNAMAPGWFPSEMTDGLLGIPAFLELCNQQTPIGRIGRAEELVGPLLLLASDAGSYVTGSVVTVDGGFTSTTGSSPPSDEVGSILAGIMPDGLGEPILPVA
jgi:NAD(P)-dependent dehydrogenase (short-subunit alcohol dehydrogenase family)